MSISIDIVPIADTLEMYGDADKSSAYSLSGHVSISVSSPYSLFERRKTARILLHSVTLTFEGQTEVLTPPTGYSSARICSLTREIAPPEPVEMSNEGHEDSNAPCVWNVVFDLPIPGWLPPTENYGAEDVGVRYGLFAEAKFSHICENQSTAFSFALCSPFRSRVKTLHAQKNIGIRRVICSPEDETGARDDQQTITYLVNANLAPSPEKVRRFPAEVLKKMQVLTSVPESVDVERNEFPLVIRMRMKDLVAEECKRVQVTSISANVIQKEKYRSNISSNYARRYPIPSRSQQPPHLPLRDPHPIGSFYETGLGVYGGGEGSASRSFSLLPPGESGIYSLGEKHYAFENDADCPADSATWYTLETSVPFVRQAPDDKTLEWCGHPLLRASVASPLISIAHEVALGLTCTYDVPGTTEVAVERLSFAIPLTFAFFAPGAGHYRCITPPPVNSPELVMTQIQTQTPEPGSPMQYAPTLPAYSQLFDRNGDRKIDYLVPLPLYTPRPASASSSNEDLSEMLPLLSTGL
ncbi:hypothetical protein H0H81_007178 [Sphagnurus paluster]|uniref:Uncharacterized protein n=1 Tax=Sphagnurus paluster TaxID=117069 RepID=A0A9P7GQ44_9AGAR|nr:hypothetical protein H0H81_007178 [Sphagnurus paluster]